MNPLSNRRCFMQRAGLGAASLAMSELPSLHHLSPLQAEDLTLPKDAVQFRPEIEPLVRWVEETPRERLIEEVAERIKKGTSYRDILSALLLAGVRNIQPRPVGFKFHAVLVVHSAHQASMQAPSHERWLPIFWALDYFKDSQARDRREGNWTLREPREASLPSPEAAPKAFCQALDAWDEEAVDQATAGLARSAGAATILDLFARYGCRDYRDIGHKAIYVANSWRVLQSIGWQHAEPVLRSLAYAMLAHGGDNPAEGNQSADRAGRSNEQYVGAFPAGWQQGRVDHGATLSFAEVLREGSDLEASAQAMHLMREGMDPSCLWDAILNFSGELLRKHPGIVSLHAITTSNALHFAYKACGSETTRQKVLLQACSFMPLFRGDIVSSSEHRFDQLERSPLPVDADQALSEVFATVDKDKALAASKVFAYLEAGHDPLAFMDAARRYLFLKGSNSHDYKFTSAVLEDFFHISPRWRHHYLASSVFHLKGSEAKTNPLVERIRSAMG